MSHSVASNSLQQPTEIIFTDFKVHGLQQYGSVLKRRYPKTYIKVRVGPEQYEQTAAAQRSASPGWEQTLSFYSTKPNEQVTVLLMQESRDSAPTCLASFSDNLDKLGPSGQETKKTLTTTGQKKYDITFSFRYDIVQASTSRVFALIIGIDQYKHKPKLEGSVRDAHAFKSFLTEELEVPETNMRLLTDWAATRQGIIDAFRWLTDHPRITMGDAIIVYYAGHGSRADAPKDWVAEGGKIETICPIDEESLQGDTRIHGIPDRTIAALLRKLSDKKGNNITLIFDCCHSGGLARGDGKSQASKLGLARSAPSQYPIPADLDKDIWTFGASRAGGIAKSDHGFRVALSTHILLAGCRPDETAWETLNQYSEPCGAFTNSLLRNLRELGSAYENHTTYADLLERIVPDLTHQNPLCEGTYKDRVLFDGRAPKRDPNAFTLKSHKHDTSLFEVEVGEIHGLCPGAIFSIRAFDAAENGYQEIGQLEAAVVNPQNAILRRIPGQPHFDAWAGSKAVVKSWNSNEFSMPVFVQDTPDTPPIKIDSSPNHEPRFRHVTRRDDAEVVVRRKEGDPKMITFDRLKSPIAQYANRSPRDCVLNSPMRLENTLDAISHFHFHLSRSNHHNPKIGPDDIRIKIHRLTEIDTVNRIYATEGEDLMRNGEAIVPPSDDFVYGFTIENRTEYSLYPYLFWFDPSDYSISSWYEPHTLTMAAPLAPAIKRKDGVTPSTFGIGYGPSTADPFLFTLTDGEKRDVGFLKLFVSTRCIEMKFIEQTSPMGDQGLARSAKEKTRQAKKAEAEDTWEAVIARIVVEE